MGEIKALEDMRNTVEVVKVDAYRCTICGRTWYDEGCARRCCTCSECGGLKEDNRYAYCKSCLVKREEERHAAAIARARKVDWREYEGDGIYVEGLGSEYFFDFSPEEIIDEWEANNEEPWPGFEAFDVWGVQSEPIQLSPDWLLEQLNDGAYEDYESPHQAVKDIEDFCAEWNSKYADKVYYPDHNVLVTFGVMGV